MTITDIEGMVIEVTNLDEAIAQAIIFADMKQNDKAFKKTDKYLNAYRNDILDKLKPSQNT